MNKKSRAVINCRQRNKIRLIEYKGGKCVLCGYNKPVPRAYAFHHRYPNEKDFNISTKNWSFEALKREVDKCDLLCQNCHAEVHDVEFKELRDFLYAEYKEREARKLKKIKCKKCKKDFMPVMRSIKYCSSKCSHLAARKVERPSKDELNKLVLEYPWTTIGKRFGVSDNAVRKWAKLYELI